MPSKKFPGPSRDQYPGAGGRRPYVDLRVGRAHLTAPRLRVRTRRRLARAAVRGALCLAAGTCAALQHRPR
jgi:hypothetical protein